MESSPIRNEDIDESLWDSPMKYPSVPSSKAYAQTDPSYSDQQRREERLKQELSSVRKVNETIEGVIQSLEKAKTNMKTVNQTVGAASMLLNTWTRILSQTEHTQRLVLDRDWQGATQDMSNVEEEAHTEREAEQRRALEEQERQLNLARKAEEDEKRRTEAVPKATRGTNRGRYTSSGRAGSSASHNYTTMGGPSSSGAASSGRGAPGTRRTTSGTSRGTRPPRGRS